MSKSLRENKDQRKGGKALRYPSYHESGRCSVLSAVLFVSVSFVGVFLVQVLYIYLMGFVSPLILRLLILAAALWAQILILSGLAKSFRIRNIRAVRILSLIVLLICFYAGRCVYVNLVSEMWSRGSNDILEHPTSVSVLLRNWGILFLHPQTVFSSLAQILPYGTSSVNGSMVTGVLLLILWILEFLLFAVFPISFVVYRCSCPYDEDSHQWLSRHEQWRVEYVENYREIRLQLRQNNYEPLVSAVQDLHYYQLKGQESYAIVDFYCHKGKAGPFVSLTNVKAVQSGPRRIRHRAIILCRMLDIGDEAAAELYERLRKEKRESLQKAGGESLSFADKVSSFFFLMGRRRRNISVSMRNSRGKRPHRSNAAVPQETSQEAVSFEEQTEYSDLSSLNDEITIHVPHVTKEMEEEYQKKSK